MPADSKTAYLWSRAASQAARRAVIPLCASPGGQGRNIDPDPDAACFGPVAVKADVRFKNTEPATQEGSAGLDGELQPACIPVNDPPVGHSRGRSAGDQTGQ